MATIEAKKKLLGGVIDSINKNAKKTVVGFADNEVISKKLEIVYIPNISLSLNELYGGLPRGKTTLISGNEDSGINFIFNKKI